MPQMFLSENAAEVLFRVLFSLIFLVAGMQHILGLDQVLLRFWSTPWAPLLNSIIPAAVLVLMTGIAILVGGLGLLSGSLTRLAALLLFSVLIPITLTVQLT